jgi:hypothetical protein
MNKYIVLPYKNPREFYDYVIRKKFFHGSTNIAPIKGGQPILWDAEGPDNKAIILPTKEAFKKLGPENTTVVIGTGIKIVTNEKQKDYKCKDIGNIFPWLHYYEFDKVDIVKFSDLVAIIGNPYEHERYKGLNFYWIP